MSSRYPPPTRERSPPRYDRRPSTTFTPSGSSYRGPADSGPPSSQRDPPRGPKADFRGGGSFPFNSAPRGRGGGFQSRPSDTWDRDRDRERERERDRERDPRPPPQTYRGRDDERADWPRRDREFAASDRSVTSARDTRPFVGRERSASPVRPRRDSRESIPSTFSRLPDSATSYYAPAARGALGRGRGRGDWERGRGRNSFAGERERDLFHPRSRSRESWRDRDFDRGRPTPGDVDRRDFDRSREREVRARDPREHDIWQRDPSPARLSAGNAGVSAAAPPTSISERPAKSDLEGGRRPSAVAAPTTTVRDSRRDGESAEYFGSSRPEPSRRDQPQPSQQTPVAVGLDYGPPPSLPPATTPGAEKPANTKQQLSKTDPVTPSPASFQPPSGPKAGRTTAVASLSQANKLPAHQEPWARSEPVNRPVRPSPTPSTSFVSTEGPARMEEPVVKSTLSGPPSGDRSMPPNVPSGPRLGHAPPTKQRLPSNEPAVLPPTAPREPSKPPGYEIRSPVIPTGPRLDREVARPLPGPSPKFWYSQDFKPKPSILNTLNKPLLSEARDRAGVPSGPRQLSSFGQSQTPRALHASATMPSAPSAPKALLARSPPEAKMTLLPARQPTDQQIEVSDDVEMSVPASSEDEEEAEDDSFDEEYFAESEERHRQQMGLLEARKPPPLLEDSTAVALLIKLQFLEMMLLQAIPRPSTMPPDVSKDDVPTAVNVPTTLPSPTRAFDDDASRLEDEPPHPKGRPLRQPPINPIPTPPIEDLPYLKSGAPERRVFEDSDNEVEHEAVSILLQQEFEREAWDLRSELEEMRAEFKALYPDWKQEIGKIDQERREQQVSPAPASPAPSIAPSVTPSLTHERTRGARNTTEADLEAALLLSKQSAKEEEERREREAAASSLPNYDMEAVVPQMLRPAEVELSEFEDTNNLITNDMIKYSLSYLPPEDDFTAEEQTLFITAYCQYPKKWSKIAESLPGRTYKDCITHYYLTKDLARYKEIWRRSQPRKRGRGKAAKPRSTALMSELLRGDDGEAAPVAVTDSGRPRRAAAPTFGDAPSEPDPSTPIPQSKKLTAGLEKGNPDTTAIKTSRGRKTGSGTKVRRTKAQIQADQQQALLLGAAEASPGKPAMASKAERGRTILRGGETLPVRPEIPTHPQAQRPVEAGPQQYPVSDVPLIPAMAQAPSASQVTSYWSVPEQHKFPELLTYFGRDFAAIADFMKTKSVTMVSTEKGTSIPSLTDMQIKNYYLRQLNDGKDDFERLAQMGEQRRVAGEVIAQPPSPIAPAKRRYDTTPSIAPAPRPQTQPEQHAMDTEASIPTLKQNPMEEYSQPIIERNASGDVKPRAIMRGSPREVPLPAPLPAKTEELSRMPHDRPSLFGQKPLHGPKAGFFQDDFGLQAARQSLRGHLQERSPQILAQRLPELPRAELGQQPAMPNVGPSLLGPREPLMQTQHLNQISPAHLTQGHQSQVDKYGPADVLQESSHSRNNSSATSGHPALEPQDLSSMHRIENQHALFGDAMAGSPGLTTTPMPMLQRPRNEMLQPASAPPGPEPPKPPVKRSNVFGLLNDDPPDPPPKRPSLEAPRRTSIVSPRIAPIASAQNPLQQTRSQLLPEDQLLNRTLRGSYGHSSALSAGGGLQSTADYLGALSTPPAPSNETWMDRFDPRTQGTSSEQRIHRHSPAPTQYSVVPPTSQPPSLHSMRIESPRGLERPAADHRRTLLGPMNQIPHVPSPPPQLPTQPVPPLRSASSSSQHSRGPSLGYPASQQTSQSTSLNHPSVAQGHPQSASSTPVSSLHHRPQSSIDFPRLTIQQHMAQQSQQKQHEQHREHERQIQRQREMEVAVQREREREREREHQQQQLRREIYGIEPHPPPTVTRQNQLGAITNQSHMAFGQRDIPRTFTPPHSHGHSHSHSHSQFLGPGSLAQALNPQHQHQHSLQHQHQHQHQPLHQHQHQHQHQAGLMPHQQSAGTTQPPTQPPLHMHHSHHPQHILHPGGHPGHYRTMSQENTRREERR